MPATLYAHALTSVADVKESLGIDSGNTTKDNLIKRKINQATDMIEAYCELDNDHHFASTTYTNEEYVGTGVDQLVLKARPLITLSSLDYRNTTENISSWTTQDTEQYFTDEYSGVISGLFNFSNGYGGYRITYTAGFATIPADLAEACAILAGYLVENASSGGAAVKSKQEGQRKIEYFDPGQNIDSLFDQLGIDNMIERYVHYAIADDV